MWSIRSCLLVAVIVCCGCAGKGPSFKHPPHVADRIQAPLSGQLTSHAEPGDPYLDVVDLAAARYRAGQPFLVLVVDSSRDTDEIGCFHIVTLRSVESIDRGQRIWVDWLETDQGLSQAREYNVGHELVLVVPMVTIPHALTLPDDREVVRALIDPHQPEYSKFKSLPVEVRPEPWTVHEDRYWGGVMALNVEGPLVINRGARITASGAGFERGDESGARSPSEGTPLLLMGNGGVNGRGGGIVLIRAESINVEGEAAIAANGVNGGEGGTIWLIAPEGVEYGAGSIVANGGTVREGTELHQAKDGRIYIFGE